MMEKEDVKTVAWIAFWLVALIAGIIFCVQGIHVLVDNVPVEVRVNGDLVYKGRSAGVEVASSGANTTVAVFGGFLYMFPRAYYVSNDVELIGVKKEE